MCVVDKKTPHTISDAPKVQGNQMGEDHRLMQSVVFFLIKKSQKKSLNLLITVISELKKFFYAHAAKIIATI